jgi:5-methylcytosine-specific restriction endonuclease McrA
MTRITYCFESEALDKIKKGICPICDKPKSEWTRRKDWNCCSTNCTERFQKEKILDWVKIRQEILKRDNWTCVKCGKQPTRLIREGYQGWYDKVLKTEYLKEWKGNMNTVVDTLVIDHIKPIAIGGEMWDINNLQTLCPECNKIKTAADMGDIGRFKDTKRKQEGHILLSKLT